MTENAYTRRYLETRWHEGKELNPDNKPILQKTEFTNPEQFVDKSVDDVEKESES